MQSTPWYKKAEMVIGLSALAVSLVAMFVGVYSAYLDRAFARASVWPKVEVRSIYSAQQQRLIYQVENVGTGPAKIKYARVSLDNQPVQSWQELASLAEQPAKFSVDSIRQRVLPALAKFRAITTEDPALAEALHRAKASTSIDICYCSVFEDCWLASLNRPSTQVPHCNLPESQRFLD